jgi:dockerin type I repeat protein
MQPTNDRGQDRLDLDAPEALVRDLCRLYSPDIPVPAARDEAVLSGARLPLARRRRPRRILGWSAAAMVLLAALLWTGWLQNRDRTPEQASRTVVLLEDVDRNGRIDILDAFWLARHLRTGASLEPGWDMNRDGRVNEQDVDWLARRAVKLDA